MHRVETNSKRVENISMVGSSKSETFRGAIHIILLLLLIIIFTPEITIRIKSKIKGERGPMPASRRPPTT